MANAIKLKFGDELNVETGNYRILYEAGFTDIENIIASNVNVEDWNFDIPASSSRSTFYIQVGNEATGENGNSGAIESNLVNIKVERILNEDGTGFDWIVNPQAEILDKVGDRLFTENLFA